MAKKNAATKGKQKVCVKSLSSLKLFSQHPSALGHDRGGTVSQKVTVELKPEQNHAGPGASILGKCGSLTPHDYLPAPVGPTCELLPQGGVWILLLLLGSAEVFSGPETNKYLFWSSFKVF